MELIICKHFYSDVESNFISDTRYDIYKNYKELCVSLIFDYHYHCMVRNIEFDLSNIMVYRCGSISTLGEFRIYSNPLPMYLKEIMETLKND